MSKLVKWAYRIVTLAALAAPLLMAAWAHPDDLGAGPVFKIDWTKCTPGLVYSKDHGGCVVACDKKPKSNVVIPMLWHGALQAGDYWSTVTSSGTEANPVVRKVGLGKAKIGGFLLTYTGDIAIQKAQGRHKWPVWVYRGLLGVGYGAVIHHNRSIR